MEIKKMYMVAIQKDGGGKIKEVFEVKTINEEQFKKLKTEANSFVSLTQVIEEEQRKKEKDVLKRLELLESQNIVLKKAVCELAGLDLNIELLDENIIKLIGE
jgi:BRCT domain type II-containing protein